MKVIIDDVEYVPLAPIPSDKNLLSVLELRIDTDAGNNITIKEYLRTLLETLWLQGWTFNAKRPFGNGDWQYPIYTVLIKNELISGELDEDGYVNEVNHEEADEYVCQLINAVFYGIK